MGWGVLFLHTLKPLFYASKKMFIVRHAETVTQHNIVIAQNCLHTAGHFNLPQQSQPKSLSLIYGAHIVRSALQPFLFLRLLLYVTMDFLDLQPLGYQIRTA